MQILVLGFALPPARFWEVAATDRGMPIPTQRFGTSLLRALAASQASPIMLAAAPAANYPHNSQVVFRGSNSVHHGVCYHEIGFLNLVALKHASRVWTALRTGVRVISAQKPDAILVHGVHSPFLIAAVVLRQRFGVPIVAVLTDPPGVPHAFDSVLSRFLKQIDSRVIRGLLRRFNGIIALTPRLAQDFAPEVPYMVMEGIVPEETDDSPDPSAEVADSDTPVAVYAGGLSEKYGVGLLVRAQQLLAGRARIVVYGKGALAESIQNQTSDGSQVMYGGMVAPEILRERYREASVLVNPRPVDQYFVPYSFPSKIMEYVASGVPVVSTRLPGIPDEYWEFVQPADDTPQGLARAILTTVEDPSAPARGTAGRRWIMREKSAAAQGRRMRRFIERLALGS